MSNVDYTELLKNAILEIEKKNQRIKQLTHSLHEPIAIIGASCRFPGGIENLDQFWEFIEKGNDGITEMVDQRWNMPDYFHPIPGKPGKMYTNKFGLLNDIDKFDANFFSISAQEADTMDPQHRLLLEVCYEALESAGIPPFDMKHNSAGIFIGQMNRDYIELISDINHLSTYSGTGNAMSISSGRLAYTFNLTGPCITIDTACSSSLVSLHLACQSLRANECQIAIAGGVNLILSPAASISSSSARMLSPTGECKVFDAKADGYVRSEGCGLVILKKYSHALKDNDSILAIVRGSAINQDGHSKGLTAPNGAAQCTVINAAIKNAQVDAHDVSYVEAHGTGTALGDPIEVHTIDTIYGDIANRNTPISIGSVKANIGHCESAAGIAGLFKLVQMLRHKKIAQQIHFEEMNPYFSNNIDKRINIPTQTIPWEISNDTRLGAVNSFGYSGTNAHVILEEAQNVISNNIDNHYYVYAISAHSQHALLKSLKALSRFIEENDSYSINDLIYSINKIRTNFQYRAGGIVSNIQELHRNLLQLKESDIKKISKKPSVAFKFFNTIKVDYLEINQSMNLIQIFTNILETCYDTFFKITNYNLLEIFANSNAEYPNAIKVAVNFCLQYAEFYLWHQLGIESYELYAETGRALVVAATIGKLFSLEEGIKLSIILGEEANEKIIAEFISRIEFKKLDYDIYCIEDLSIQNSSMSAPEYWVNLSKKIQAGYHHLSEAVNVDYLICIGWHTAYPTKPNKDDAEQSSTYYSTILQLFLLGYKINWTSLYSNLQHRFIALPQYPFERKEHWWPISTYQKHHATPFIQTSANSNIFYEILTLPDGEIGFAIKLNQFTYSYLKEHQVFDKIVMPSSLYMEFILEAYKHVSQEKAIISIRELVLHKALLLNDDDLLLYINLKSLMPGENYQLKIYSLKSKQNLSDWQLHASALVKMVNINSKLTGSIPLKLVDFTSEANNSDVIKAFYKRSSASGINYGKSFQLVDYLYIKPGRSVARIKLNPSTPCESYLFHPTQLDACLQTIGMTINAEGFLDYFVPVKFENVEFIMPIPEEIWCETCLLTENDEILNINSQEDLINKLQHQHYLRACLRIYDRTGNPLGIIERFTAEKVTKEQINPATNQFSSYFKKDWVIQNLTHQSLNNSILKKSFLHETSIYAVNQLHKYYKKFEYIKFTEAFRHLESACVSIVVDIMRNLGFNFSDTRPFNLDTIAKELNIIPFYNKQLLCLLNILEKSQILSSDGNTWSVQYSPNDPKMANTVDKLLLDYPFLKNEIEFLSHCATSIPSIFSGNVSAAEIFFDNNSQLNVLYAEPIGSVILNQQIKDLIENLLSTIPEDHNINILEVGAGTGTTTACILQALNIRKYNYTFTDISQHFINQAKLKFADNNSMNYQILDINDLTSFQNSVPLQFDIIIAVNVIHATPFIEKSLNNIKTLLLPGGKFIMRELVKSQKWLDLTFGLTEGWWSFKDHDLRKDSPLLTQEQWLSIFAQTRFQSYSSLALNEESLEAVFIAEKNHKTNKHWIVFTGDCSITNQIRSQFERDNKSISLVYLEKHGGTKSINAYYITPTVESITQLLQDICKQHPEKELAIIYLWPLVSQSINDLEFSQCIEVCAHYPLILHQAINKSETPITQMHFLTDRAQAIIPFVKNVQYPAQALLWGFGLVLAHETPDYIFSIIDIDSTDPTYIKNLFLELNSKTNDVQVGFRDGKRYVVRLNHLSMTKTIEDSTLQENASYLITGGLGDIGFLTCEFLVQHGAKYIILLGRSPAKNTIAEKINALEKSGIKIKVIYADVSNYTELKKVFEKVDSYFPPVRGIIHSVGVLDDGVILQQNWERFMKVLSPKVIGAWNLHILSQNMKLDFFILYSSAAAIIGNPGQANHSAANAFLDSLAHYRHGINLPALSINWGAWSDIGSVAKHNIIHKLKNEDSAVGLISKEDGLNTFKHMFNADIAQFIHIPLRLDKLKLNRSKNSNNLFDELISDSNADIITEKANDILILINQAPLSQRPKILASYLKSKLIRLLNIEEKSFDIHTNLFDAGVDSLIAIDIRAELQTDFDCKLKSTLLFNYPTIDSLIKFLLQEIISNPTSLSLNEENEDLSANIHDQFVDHKVISITDEIKRLKEKFDV